MSLSKKTPQKLNEAVANKLGLKYRFSQLIGKSEGVIVEGVGYRDFATDYAAAWWALTRFCDNKGWGYLIEREPGSKQISIEFSRGSQGHYFGRQDGFALPELICRAIVEAAE